MIGVKPTRLNTPALAKMVKEDLVLERIKHDEKNLADDWENVEQETCPKCKGFGKNPDLPEDPFCYACDGSGIWYILTYGMSNKLPYSYTDEYGVDFVKEACKAEREAFAEAQLAGKIGNRYGIRPYMLTKTLEMEFLSRGYTPQELRQGPMTKEIANIVAREYPEFMCVTYTNF